MHSKKELDSLQVVDAAAFSSSSYQGYFLEGTLRNPKASTSASAIRAVRVLAPLSVDEDIDLVWLREVAGCCAAAGKELFVCLHSSEGVVYEVVTTSMH